MSAGASPKFAPDLKQVLPRSNPELVVEKTLEELNKMKREILNAYSHDVRPIANAAIVGSMSWQSRLSVTRWIQYFSLFGYLQKIKYAQNS